MQQEWNLIIQTELKVNHRKQFWKALTQLKKKQNHKLQICILHSLKCTAAIKYIKWCLKITACVKMSYEVGDYDNAMILKKQDTTKLKL